MFLTITVNGIIMHANICISNPEIKLDFAFLMLKIVFVFFLQKNSWDLKDKKLSTTGLGNRKSIWQ